MSTEDSSAPIPPRLLRDPVVLLATGFGSGLIRPAPGTWGTLAAVPLALGLLHLSPWVAAGLILLAALAGIAICGHAGRRIGVADHGGIVWDEFVGYWIAVVPLARGWHDLLAGFVLFRLFDIAKPWPVSWADRSLPGGLGVMADDLIAGCYAALGLLIFREALGLAGVGG